LCCEDPMRSLALRCLGALLLISAVFAQGLPSFGSSLAPRGSSALVHALSQGSLVGLQTVHGQPDSRADRDDHDDHDEGEGQSRSDPNGAQLVALSAIMSGASPAGLSSLAASLSGSGSGIPLSTRSANTLSRSGSFGKPIGSSSGSFGSQSTKGVLICHGMKCPHLGGVCCQNKRYCCPPGFSCAPCTSPRVRPCCLRLSPEQAAQQALQRSLHHQNQLNEADRLQKKLKAASRGNGGSGGGAFGPKDTTESEGLPHIKIEPIIIFNKVPAGGMPSVSIPAASSSMLTPGSSAMISSALSAALGSSLQSLSQLGLGAAYPPPPLSPPPVGVVPILPSGSALVPPQEQGSQLPPPPEDSQPPSPPPPEPMPPGSMMPGGLPPTIPGFPGSTLLAVPTTPLPADGSMPPGATSDAMGMEGSFAESMPGEPPGQ